MERDICRKMFCTNEKKSIENDKIEDKDDDLKLVEKQSLNKTQNLIIEKLE